MGLVRRMSYLVALGVLVSVTVALALVASPAQVPPPLTQRLHAVPAGDAVSGAAASAASPGTGVDASRTRGTPPQQASPGAAGSTRAASPGPAGWLAFTAVVSGLVAVATTPLWFGRRRRFRVRRAGGMPGFPPSVYHCEDWQEAACCRSKTAV
jgi:hypothetical protein